MIKRTITYTDYNGNEHTEDFRFNLSRLDIIKLDDDFPEGFMEAYDKAVKNNDGRAVTRIFINLIRRAYGVKSEDGLRFDKPEGLGDSFIESPAFDALLKELTSDPNVMQDFFNGIVPADLQNQAALAALA